MFRTSRPATASAFHDREVALERLARLVQQLRAGNPTWLAILGQRKVGKTSLLLEAARRMETDSLRFVVLDVFDALPVSPEIFRQLATRVLDAVLGEELGVSLHVLAGDAAEFRAALQRSPRFQRLTAPVRSVVLELPGRAADESLVRDALSLPEQLAKQLGVHLVVAIDEFQELAALGSRRGGVDLLPLMRATWQKHAHVAYVISGSAKSTLTELVASDRSPFFQHFDIMEVGPFAAADAAALLTRYAPPERPIPAALATRACEVLGGHPFYLQLFGEAVTETPPPYGDDALKDALQRLLFSRTGRLALYFANEHQRLVGRSTGLAAVLEALADGPTRVSDVAARSGASSGATVRSLERLEDAVEKTEAGLYRMTDPAFAAWVRWRAPGGTVVPMKLVGDEAEAQAAEHLAAMGFDLVYQSRASRGAFDLLAAMGFDLVYQSRASRGAFDLLAVRGAAQLGVQVKRSALPLRFATAEWNRMGADAAKWGWVWVVAAVAPDASVSVLDPARAVRRKGVTMTSAATIRNLLSWLDRSSRATRSAPRGAAAGKRKGRAQ